MSELVELRVGMLRWGDRLATQHRYRVHGSWPVSYRKFWIVERISELDHVPDRDHVVAWVDGTEFRYEVLEQQACFSTKPAAVEFMQGWS